MIYPAVAVPPCSSGSTAITICTSWPTPWTLDEQVHLGGRGHLGRSQHEGVVTGSADQGEASLWRVVGHLHVGRLGRRLGELDGGGGQRRHHPGLLAQAFGDIPHLLDDVLGAWQRLRV